MYLYKNLNKYFDKCENCGNCCHIPGVFLPEQIDILAEELNLDKKQLFDEYLVAELCAPSDLYPPALVLSPVKVDNEGNRLPSHIIDVEYYDIRDLYCIFRDNENKLCKIHKYKPFACALLICKKMTKDKSISFGKSYYYYKWKDNQEIIFSILPELEPVYNEMVSLVNELQKNYAEIIIKRNKIITKNLAEIISGHPIKALHIEK